MTMPVAPPVDPAAPAPVAPVAPAVPAPPAAPAALHDDPVIAKALEGLTEAQRETLLTTGGRNALAARAEEVKAAKAAAAAAGEAAKAELAQTIGKALGLVENEADPAKLAEQITASNADAKQAKVELAVYQGAATVNADAAALLDSRAFMKKLADIDPGDGVAIAAAIGEAVMANPALAKTVTAGTPGVPAVNPALGSSASGAPDLGAQIEAAKKAGDLPLVIHLENQKLRSA